MNRVMTTVALALAALAAAPVNGQGTAPPAPAEAAAMSDAEVRRVDRENRKVTLRHGDIPNLQMPPMTMVFEVRDAALLDKLEPGKRIRFSAIQSGGAYVVTAVEPVR